MKNKIERNIRLIILSMVFIAWNIYLTQMVDNLIHKILLIYFMCSILGFCVWYVLMGEKTISR